MHCTYAVTIAMQKFCDCDMLKILLLSPLVFPFFSIELPPNCVFVCYSQKLVRLLSGRNMSMIFLIGEGSLITSIMSIYPGEIMALGKVIDKAIADDNPSEVRIVHIVQHSEIYLHVKFCEVMEQGQLLSCLCYSTQFTCRSFILYNYLIALLVEHESKQICQELVVFLLPFLFRLTPIIYLEFPHP